MWTAASGLRLGAQAPATITGVAVQSAPSVRLPELPPPPLLGGVHAAPIDATTSAATNVRHLLPMAPPPITPAIRRPGNGNTL